MCGLSKTNKHNWWILIGLNDKQVAGIWIYHKWDIGGNGYKVVTVIGIDKLYSTMPEFLRVDMGA